MKAIIVLIFFVLASLSADETIGTKCTTSELIDVGFNEDYRQVNETKNGIYVVHIPSIKYDKNTKIAKVWIAYLLYKSTKREQAYEKVSCLIDYKNDKYKILSKILYSCDGNVIESFKVNYENLNTIGWEDTVPGSGMEEIARRIKVSQEF